MNTLSPALNPAAENNGTSLVGDTIGPERVAGTPTATLTTRTSEPAEGAGAAPVIAGGSTGVQPGPVYSWPWIALPRSLAKVPGAAMTLINGPLLSTLLL